MATTDTLAPDEIAADLRARGFVVIPVVAGADPEDADGDIFDGGLSDYFTAIQALNATVVRICHETFDPAVLSETPDEEDSEFLAVAPALSTFRRYRGQVCAVRLSGVASSCVLDLVLHTAWRVKFDEAFDAAELQLEERESARDSDEEAQAEARCEELLALLRGFEDDPACLALGTQSKIRAYVLERHPELSELEPGELKEGVIRLAMKADLRRPPRRRSG